MTTWTPQSPGAGVISEIAAVAQDLRLLAPRLRAAADALGAAARELGDGARGLAASAWTAQTDALAVTAAALGEPTAAMAGAIDRYAARIAEIQARERVLGSVAEAEAAPALVVLAALREQADADLVAALVQATRTTSTSSGRELAQDASAAGRGWQDAIGASFTRWLVSGLTDDELTRLLEDSPHVADLLMTPTDLAAESRFAAVAEAAGAPAGPDRVAAVAAALAAMPAADRAALARLHPWFVGNLDGAPFADRIHANTTAIRAALHRARREGSADPQGAAARYEKLLAAGHQVVLFDPEGSRFAEIVGDLDAASAGVGVLVGGTGTNLGNAHRQRDRVATFVDRADGRLAMITFQGGEMPQTLTDAASSSYANDVAPHLRDFVAALDLETDAPVTVAGHSYGGSVVGAAESAGMVADRILHIASAGAGPGVGSVADYQAPDTPRYSMTAPGDPIGHVQGHELGSWGHGADPDVMPGLTQLETGRVVHGDPSSPLLQGIDAHSGVLRQDSTAWRNIYGVLTGGDVMLYGEPRLVEEIWTPGGYVQQRELPMTDPTYDPPTVDVP
ncbi:hypothetical protein GCM10011331_20620 [Flavimobilis marinus]|uniref:Alpha/beta hydrolase n=1 Tax=Flavimobilis marinus TaxID=285351 RepID=A0A1I2H0B9_9MICO|nr:hypothetical protein [Flavimobilis marinus]GHG54661.1 hypothetical protein GCM10011331_20620 [Flavimobilis marinus]SFF23092.1 hypothetical protein SAMN04488035_2109 [Flavimobilis marinus]